MRYLKRLMKRMLTGAVPLAVGRWFLDPVHGPRRRAQARDVAADAGRRVQSGARQLRATIAARSAGRTGPMLSQLSSGDAAGSPPA